MVNYEDDINEDDFEDVKSGFSTLLDILVKRDDFRDIMTEFENEFMGYSSFCMGQILCIASKHHKLSYVKYLVEIKDVDVNSYFSTVYCFSSWHTPLMCAIESGDLDIFDYLLSQGANINQFNDGREIIKSIDCHRKQMFERLLNEPNLYYSIKHIFECYNFRKDLINSSGRKISVDKVQGGIYSYDGISKLLDIMIRKYGFDTIKKNYNRCFPDSTDNIMIEKEQEYIQLIQESVPIYTDIVPNIVKFLII